MQRKLEIGGQKKRILRCCRAEVHPIMPSASAQQPTIRASRVAPARRHPPSWRRKRRTLQILINFSVQQELASPHKHCAPIYSWPFRSVDTKKLKHGARTRARPWTVTSDDPAPGDGRRRGIQGKTLAPGLTGTSDRELLSVHTDASCILRFHITACSFWSGGN